MRKILIAIFFLLASLQCVAGNKCEPIDTIKIESECGYVIVPVKVNGRSLRFVLDTGVENIVVWRDSLVRNDCGDALLLKYVDGGSNIKVGIKSEQNEIEIGSYKFKKFIDRVPESLLTQILDSLQTSGILGYNFLMNSNMCTKIDARQGIMVLTRQKDLFKHEKCHKFHVKESTCLPTINVSIAPSNKIKVKFDSGFGGLLTIDSLTMKGLMADKRFEQFNEIKYGSYRDLAAFDSAMYEQKTRFIKSEYLKVGKLTISQPVIIFDSRNETNLLGADLFKYAVVYFNSRKKYMGIAPYD